MNTFAGKIQENKKASVANNKTEKTTQEASTFQVADNRTNSMEQLKMQSMVNNSPHLIQMRGFHATTNHLSSGNMNNATANSPIQMKKGDHHKRGEFDLYNEIKEQIKAENPDLPFTSPEIARLAAARFREQYGAPDKNNKIGK